MPGVVQHNPALGWDDGWAGVGCKSVNVIHEVLNKFKFVSEP